MKRKRMLSALLVVAMAATMFAGCGNKGGSNFPHRVEKQQMMEILKSLQLSLLFRDPRSMMITKFSRSSLRRPA